MPKIMDSVDSSPFGQWLEDARRRRGITMDALADAAGVNQSLLSYYKNGTRKPKRSTIEKIVTAIQPEDTDGERHEQLLSDALLAAGFLPEGLTDVETDPGPSYTPERVEIGRRMTLRREEVGLTQAEVARRAGLKSEEAYGAYERGRTSPDAVRMQRIARALKTTVAELLGELPEGMSPQTAALVRHFNRLPQPQQDAFSIQVKALHDAQDAEDDEIGRFGKRAE